MHVVLGAAPTGLLGAAPTQGLRHVREVAGGPLLRRVLVHGLPDGDLARKDDVAELGHLPCPEEHLPFGLERIPHYVRYRLLNVRAHLLEEREASEQALDLQLQLLHLQPDDLLLDHPVEGALLDVEELAVLVAGHGDLAGRVRQQRGVVEDGALAQHRLLEAHDLRHAAAPLHSPPLPVALVDGLREPAALLLLVLVLGDLGEARGQLRALLGDGVARQLLALEAVAAGAVGVAPAPAGHLPREQDVAPLRRVRLPEEHGAALLHGVLHDVPDALLHRHVEPLEEGELLEQGLYQDRKGHHGLVHGPLEHPLEVGPLYGQEGAVLHAGDRGAARLVLQERELAEHLAGPEPGDLASLLVPELLQDFLLVGTQALRFRGHLLDRVEPPQGGEDGVAPLAHGLVPRVPVRLAGGLPHAGGLPAHGRLVAHEQALAARVPRPHGLRLPHEGRVGHRQRGLPLPQGRQGLRSIHEEAGRGVLPPHGGRARLLHQHEGGRPPSCSVLTLLPLLHNVQALAPDAHFT
mmetsp:Transcript_124386/g.363258  ORF Transcript_124386/g.363258 Transcript_124386/m.363258 type:complete len:522 (+) Transcript_124386:1813-3378(+)